MSAMYVRDPETGKFIPVGGGGGSAIDDTTPSTVRVYSSKKTQDEIDRLDEQINEQKEANATLKASTFKYVGQLFDKPEGRAYVGWPLGSVKYDPNDDTVNILVNVADTHDMTNDANRPDLYLCKMNPHTLECVLSKIVYDSVVVNQTNADEVTWIPGTKEAYSFGLCIGSNGDYLFMPNYCAKSYLFRSRDKGASWEVKEINLAATNSTTRCGLMQTSTGRLIVSTQASYFWYSDDDGLNWTQCATPKVHNYGHEACIVELKENELIAVMRKSWASSVSEPAVVCYSHDNGTTWTECADSETITEMTQSGAAIAVLDNGMVELYATSRTPHGDALGVIWRHTATIDDAMSDKWSSARAVHYSTAWAGSDFGYPGCCVDPFGNTHLVWYDGDADKSGSTNYFYANAYRDINRLPINSDEFSTISRIFPVSAAKVTSMLTTLRLELLEKIEQMGGSSGGGDTGGEDTGGGSSGEVSYVKDGLYDEIDFLGAAANGTVYTGKNNKITCSAASTDNVTENGLYKRGTVGAVSGVSLANDLPYSNGVTFEIELNVEGTSKTSGAVAANPTGFKLNGMGQLTVDYVKTDGTNKTGTGSITGNVYPLDTVGYSRCAVVITPDAAYAYINGALTITRNYAELEDFASLKNTAMTDATFGSSVATNGVTYATRLRVYNRALTAAEIKQNYDYQVSLRGA